MNRRKFLQLIPAAALIPAVGLADKDRGTPCYTQTQGECVGTVKGGRPGKAEVAAWNRALLEQYSKINEYLDPDYLRRLRAR